MNCSRLPFLFIQPYLAQLLPLVDLLHLQPLFVLPFFKTFIKRITTLGAEELIRFETAFPFYQEFTRNPAVLRALLHNCLWYLTDHFPSEGKWKLMRLISYNGHGMYSVASAAQIL